MSGPDRNCAPRDCDKQDHEAQCGDNPRYTGHQVWGKAVKVEDLIDVEDVGLGHQTRQRPRERSEWVWSKELVHEALVSPDDFAEVQKIAAAGRYGHQDSKRRASKRRYVFSGRVRCALCNNRMEGSWNNNASHYRCQKAAGWLDVEGVDHPRTVYVREARIEAVLDPSLAETFKPETFEAACEAMCAAQTEPDEATSARIEAAERRIADCDARLARYKATLDAGGDPAVIAQWMSETSGERLAAQRELDDCRPVAPLTTAEIRTLVKGVAKVRSMLVKATRIDPAAKAQLYDLLGVEVTYDPVRNVVRAKARPRITCSRERVGGGT